MKWGAQAIAEAEPRRGGEHETGSEKAAREGRRRRPEGIEGSRPKAAREYETSRNDSEEERRRREAEVTCDVMTCTDK